MIDMVFLNTAGTRGPLDGVFDKLFLITSDIYVED